MRNSLEKIASLMFIAGFIAFGWAVARWVFPEQTQMWADLMAAAASDMRWGFVLAFALIILSLLVLTLSGVIGHFGGRTRKR